MPDVSLHVGANTPSSSGTTEHSEKRMNEWRSAMAVAALAGVAALLWLAAPAGMTSHGTVLLLFVMLSLTLGLAHGAADVWLIARQYSRRSSRVWAVYALAVLVLAVALRPWPDTALALLLLLSIWHFGEGFEAPATLLARTVRGGAPLALVFGFAPAPLMDVVQLITATEAVRTSISWMLWTLIAWAWLPLFLIWVWLEFWPKRKEQRTPVLELALLAGLFANLPPLLGFALYFGLYHSLTHLLRLLRLTHDSRAPKPMRVQAWALLGLALLVTWGLLVGLLFQSGASLLALTTIDTGRWLQAIVVVLAAVSAPHAVLISRWAKTQHTLNAHQN
jgi:beta-carotene 15,15'-dioxygenase